MRTPGSDSSGEGGCVGSNGKAAVFTQDEIARLREFTIHNSTFPDTMNTKSRTSDGSEDNGGEK